MKEEKECIFLILSKLKGPFHIFAYTFLSTIDAMGDKFIIPNLEGVCESLVREEIKISTLEITSSSSKALSTSHSKGKDKQQSKHQTTNPSPQQVPKSKYSQPTSNPTCFYCKKTGRKSNICKKKDYDDK